MSQVEISIESPPRVKDQTTLGLAAVFLTYFLAAFTFNGVNIAAPMIAADLKGMALYSWAISLPALAAAFVTLLFGKLSDTYGRRAMLMTSLLLFILGAVLSALSQTFIFNIAARVINALGFGAVSALCFSVIGDFYAPVERSKWTGLLQISAGVAASIAPTLVGFITDSVGWRYFFWGTVPLAIVCGIFVWKGAPSRTNRTIHSLDYPGACVLAVASSCMILGFSLADRNPWISIQVLGLLMTSLVFWVLFIWIEKRAEEPILEPQILTNRTFLTASVAAILSFFGGVGIMNFYPLFLQGVQGTSATLSGMVLTPFTMLMAFIGVPTGLLIAKTKRYKWMFVLGYAVLTAAMFCTVAFNYETPVWAGILVMILGGLGGGAIPTINILVVQFALPKRLLGMAVAGIFFVVALGNAITPAILGTAMNFRYGRQLQVLLPDKLSLHADAATMNLISDPRVLMSQEAVAELRDTLNDMEYQEANLYNRTVDAIRKALQSGLKLVFLIGALTMLLSFLFIITIPKISIDSEVKDKRPEQY